MRMHPRRAARAIVVLIAMAGGCGSRSAEQRQIAAAPARDPARDRAAPVAPVAPAPPSSGPAEPLAMCKAPAAAEEPALGRRMSRLGEPKRVATAGDVCGVADSNLAIAERAILARPAPARGPAPVAWNRKQPPARLEQIARRFGLLAAERAQLARDGFVVAARLAQPSWGWAYHEIYQSQLPIYVSADGILHAVYAAHDGLVARLEQKELRPRLAALLAAVHCALPGAAGALPPATARDLDVYLTVARSLLEDREVASALGEAAVAAEARALTGKAKAAGPMEVLALFGRDRVIDFSQYQPRGHYTGDLAPYFRAAMWLSRLELNLVSRSSRSSAPGDTPDPRETPREVLAAIALARLVDATGQRAELDRIEQVLALLAGRREDVPLPALVELARGAGISDLRAPDAAAKLRAAIGETYQRTARIHYMPEGSTELPAIATFLGPRIVADTAALRGLAHAEIRGRDRVVAGDLAVVLGHDRGREYVKQDLARFPDLSGAHGKARQALAAAPRTGDLYGAWLGAILGLAKRPDGAVPAFMETAAFADLRVSSALAAYAQLRHDHVLLAGQPYGEGGCEIPDGYVEPAVAVYEGVAAYADLGARNVALLDGAGAQAARAYFERLGQIARVLAAISRIELANQPLPVEALRWLSMIVEILPFGSDGRPTYTGWYFDLFEDRSDGIAQPDLIADTFTSPAAGVSYAGVGAPRLGIFVVDTGGGPRAMVGPVAHAYEHLARPGARRLTDETARALAPAERSAPWLARFTVAAPPEPSFQAELDFEAVGDDSVQVMVIESQQAIPSLTIRLLDHHRAPIREVTRAIGKGTTRVRLPKLAGDVHVKSFGFSAGDFHAVESPCGCCGCEPMRFGAFANQAPKAPEAEAGEAP